MTTPEGRVKAKVKRALDAYGDGVYREMPVPGGFGKSGLDFTVCFFGRFVAIETKRPGKDLTPRQKARKDEIERAGGLVFGVDGTEKPVPGMTPWTRFESYLRGIARPSRKKAA